jgi:hypothetical protein
MSALVDDFDELFGTDEVVCATTSSSACPITTTTAGSPELREEMTIKQVAIVQSMSGVGGGRGVFAQTSLTAGILVVLEWPILTWDDLDVSSASDMITLISRILNNREAHLVTQSLHPQNLSDVTAEELAAALEGFSDEPGLHQLLKDTQKEEIIRIYLALKHNGFGSGLYKDLCMVNHSCDPNCIKFEPRAGSRGASEIWTTRDIAAGEEITISYCSPIESLTIPMRSYLLDQHSFNCRCIRCLEFEVFKSPSTLSEMIEEWDSWIGDSEFELQSLKYEVSDIGILDKMADECNRIHSQLKVHQTDIFPSDLLRLQAHNRILFGSIALKKLSLFERMASTEKTKSKQGQGVEPAQLVKVGKELLQCNSEILRLQRKYLGKDHPDIITTITDMMNALDFLSETLSTAEVNDFLQRLLWDEVFGDADESKAVSNSKQLRAIIKQDTTRLKNLYSIAKRYPEAVKVIKCPGLSFWGKF